MPNGCFRFQGDIPFYSHEGPVNGEVKPHQGSFVLALGEKTLHRHVITVERPEQMVVRDIGNGQFILELVAPGTVTHEEHLPIILPPGTYRVGKEREVDHFSETVRRVID